MVFGLIIDWAAWATFAAGLLAVGGAVVIGRKQIGITSRQAEISHRQTQIQEGQLQLQQLGLKIAIFERRMKVFETTLDYVAKISGDDEIADGDDMRFVLAVAEARFLFTSTVFEKLQSWATKCRALQEARKSAVRGEDGKPVETPDMTELRRWMDNEGPRFIDIFGEEMNLSEISAPVTATKSPEKHD